MILRLLSRLFRPLLLRVLIRAPQVLERWLRSPGGRTVFRRPPALVPVRVPVRPVPRGRHPHERR